MRLPYSLLLLALVTQWLVPGTIASAQTPRGSRAQRHSRVDAIFSPWSGKATPGCAVGVSRDGVLDYARGYGMANLEYALPLTPRSVFNLASISKQFTAFSVGLLAQEGKLSLDDDVRKYVPELPAFGKTITLAHLMHHTNGLREQGQLLTLAGWRGDDLSTEADVLWALTRQRGVNFEPGTEILYGNAAYTLQAVIVRRVSGKSLRDFANERLFKPLGMSDTGFQDDHNAITPRRATGYVPSEGGWRISMPNTDNYGPGNLLSTIGDLLKWEQNLMDGRVGGPALTAVMKTSGKLNSGIETGYGGGLHLGEHRGLRTVRHDGMASGFRTEAVLFPDQRLAIVVLCNGGSIDSTDLSWKVAEVYLGDLLKDTMPPAVALPEAELSALAGNYWSPLTDEVVRLEFKDGALREVGSTKAFVHIGEGAFRPGESKHVWRFAAQKSQAPRELSIKDVWPTTRDFIRLSAPMPASTDLAAFAGQYRSEEVDMTYTVRLADGKLAVRWPRRDEVVLEPVGGDRFVGSLGAVTFTRAASGSVDGFLVSSRRLRRFRAERREPPASKAPSVGRSIP
ncbi:serine hydrolase domain-containing protein [Myxococcus qinghaiensis]|uniref:serine hydrolase domain-containing protein n=1 Tax=Myxococcus qinghaiensis TaxID=2906758 RepID=UPI0020A7AD16|nr:serine hydrolase domain-containing protein [Myxococcus qinghaiensis]MCP3166435.1 beta-lactamase family protein [Myxococcus qinghaiensis]